MQSVFEFNYGSGAMKVGIFFGLCYDNWGSGSGSRIPLSLLEGEGPNKNEKDLPG